MNKTILFAGYVRKSGAIGGVDAEFSKPMNIFLESTEERKRFEQSVDIEPSLSVSKDARLRIGTATAIRPIFRMSNGANGVLPTN